MIILLYNKFYKSGEIHPKSSLKYLRITLLFIIIAVSKTLHEMFKKSDSHSQLDMFSSPTEYFRDSKRKKYLKNDSWHNQFRNHVVMRVDESIFSVLYTEGNGAPNASIRVLVGMMILKEGQGWSDEQLFENCQYNLLTRSALGLMSLEDAEPVPSTYYLFRRKLVEYAREHGEDLFKKCQA